MSNPDAENINNQITQPYQPASRQFIQPYREYPAPPASQSYRQPSQPSQQYPPPQQYQSRSWSAENNYAMQGEKLTVRPQAQSPRNREGSMGNAGKAAKRSKAQALVIVKTLKNWLIVGSVLCFGVISGLVITHTTGVTAQSSTNNSTQQAAPTTPDQGGFFQQPQGGNGIGNNGTSQNPVSSTRVS
jgi:hypothetical protein